MSPNGQLSGAGPLVSGLETERESGVRWSGGLGAEAPWYSDNSGSLGMGSAAAAESAGGFVDGGHVTGAGAVPRLPPSPGVGHCGSRWKA